MAKDQEFSKLTKEEAIALLNKAAEENNKAVLHPDLVKRLIELGVEIRIKEGETLGEFFDRARAHAEALINQLPPIPNWLEYQFQRPYFEARCCLLTGLYGASITLSAILLEHMLKWAAFCVETTLSKEPVPPDRWKTIEDKMQFGDAVSYAKRWGLVDKALSKELFDFRDRIRNIQGHQLLYKATDGVEFQKSAVIDFSAKTCQTDRALGAHQNPTIAAIAKEKMDEMNAQPVFVFMHSCMEHIFSKRDEVLENARKIEKANCNNAPCLTSDK